MCCPTVIVNADFEGGLEVFGYVELPRCSQGMLRSSRMDLVVLSCLFS